MESAENTSKGLETKETELESVCDDPGTSSCVMETQEDVTEIVDEEFQAKASEICLTMPVWDDDAPENEFKGDEELDERLLLGDDAEDAQDMDLAQMETGNIDTEINLQADDVLNSVIASEVKHLGEELAEEGKNTSFDISEKESVDAAKILTEELKADVKMDAKVEEDLDSDVEVLRDDIANIRNSQGVKSESCVAVKESVVLTNEAEPEMMILDDASDEDNMYDLEVLDSWEEGAELEDEETVAVEKGDDVKAEEEKEGEVDLLTADKEKVDKGTAEEKKGDELTAEEEKVDKVAAEEEKVKEVKSVEEKVDKVATEEEKVDEVKSVEEKVSEVTEETKLDKVITEEAKVDKLTAEEVKEDNEKLRIDHKSGAEDNGDAEERVDDVSKVEKCTEEESVGSVKDNQLNKTLNAEVEVVDIMEVGDESNNVEGSKDLNMKEMYETLFRLKEQELKNFDIAETASKAEITKLTESNKEQATKIVHLERELDELRSLVKKLETGGGEDSKEALLVMLSKKKLEVDKLNDTIEEVEDNLQKVFAEKVSLALKVEELEKQSQDSKKSIDNRDAEIVRLKDELQDALDNVKLLENELQSSHAKEDMIIEKQLDYEEQIKILEIDLEFAREKRLQETETYLNEIRLIEEKLSSAEESLAKEKKNNGELRSSLKEEMKVRINELKDSMSTEMISLKSQVESLKASELEALRKLEDNRSKMEVMTKQNRQLKADLKSKAMEVDAYANIAQQLKNHILKLEEKEGKKSKIENNDKKDKKEVIEEEEEEEETEESGSPEIITIDTDDQDSNGEDEGVNDSEKPMKESVKSATKRQFSPDAKNEHGKKLKLSLSSSVANSSMNNVSRDDDVDSESIVREEVNVGTSEEDKIKKEKDRGVSTADKDTSIVRSPGLNESNATNVESGRGGIYEELQEVRRVLAEKEKELAALASNVNVNMKVHVALETEISRLQSELSGMIEARDKMQPQLVLLTEELNNERSKVEILAAQLRERAVIEERVLSEQQSRLSALQVQLKSIESELSERDRVIKGLQGEIACLAADKVTLTESNQKLENEVAKTKDEVAVYELERLKLTEVTEKFDRVSEELNCILLEREQLIARISILEAADAGLKLLTDRNEALQAELSVALGEQEKQKRLVLELTQEASQVGELQQMVDRLKSDVQEAQSKRFELIEEMTRRQQEVEKERDSLQGLVTEQQNVIKEAEVERTLNIEMAEASNRTVEDLKKEVTDAVVKAEELQQDVERLRQHVENVETQLTDKERTIQELRNKAHELTCKQEEKLIEAGKVEKIKHKLAETKQELANALNGTHSLTAKVEQLHSEMIEKEKLRLKLEALEIELADVLQSRSDVGLKLNDLRSETIKQDEYSVKLREVHGSVAEMVAKGEEMNTRVSQLEESLFTNETNPEDTSLCLVANVHMQTDVKTVENDLVAIKFTRENLQAKLVELERHNAQLSDRLHLLGSELRANSEGKLEETTSKTSLATSEISKELFKLEGDVKSLVSRELLLNRSVLELQKEVTEDRSSYSTKSDANVDGVKDQLSELTSLVAELTKKCDEMDGLLNASKEREAAMKESLGESEKAIEELKKSLKSAVGSNESLQNRVQLLLTNGRRMETMLHKLENSACSYKKNSVANDPLQVVQRERDDLVKKLEDAENAKRRLKAKVITLAMTLKCKQNNLQNTSGQSVDLDSWEQVVNEVRTSSTSSLSELVDCSKTEQSSKSVLNTNNDENKSKENDNCGQKRSLGGGRSLSCSSAAKKMCMQDKDDSKLPTGKALALNTITNSTPHSHVVPVAQDSGMKTQPVAAAMETQKKTECKVQ